MSQYVVIIKEEAQEDLKRLGVKVQFCRKFYNSFKPREK